MKDNRLEKVDLLWRLFMIISGNEEVQVPILAVLDGPPPNSLALPSKAFDRCRFFSQWSFFLRLGLFQQIFFRIFFLKMFQKHPMDGIFRAHSSAMPCRLIPVLPCAACFNFWSRGKFRNSKLKIWPLPNSLDVDISISLISASWSFFWDGLGVFFFRF